MEARRTRHAVYNITYHWVWCPKYRRKVFTGSVAALAAQPDHVHLLAGFPPTLAVHQILHRIKGYTSYALRQAFSWLKRQLPCLWTRSCYVGTVGEVLVATIRRYIEAQKGCHVQKER